ncbi:MAG TPA: DNA mismatch repair protein MutS, partial [Patescibacteria group bacterium]
MSEAYDFSTPMMQQYLKLKAEYADCILLFRLGDFYEMFLDDAKVGADVLEITLTSRSRGKDGRIPMAGVPYHAVDSYISKLVKAGYKVALCDQMSEPGKGLVERQVTRIITPGTVLDQQSLDSRSHNYLLLLCQRKNHLQAAAADIGTGDVRLQEFNLAHHTRHHLLHRIVATLQPSEVLLDPRLYQDKELYQLLANYPLTVYPLPIPLQAAAAGSPTVVDTLRKYLAETQKQTITHLSPPQPILTDEYLQLDPATIANLELVDPNHFRNQKHTLLSVLDRTHTAMGGRLLRQWLLQPLTNQEKIETRLTSVEWLLKHQPITEKIHRLLPQMGDVERLLSRLSVGIGTPRDARLLLNSLKIAQKIRDVVIATNSPELRTLFPTQEKKLSQMLPALDQLLVEEPPVDATQGKLIAENQHAELDRLRSLIRVTKDKLMALEQQERTSTGITTLKVRFNKVFGFYIEISNTHLHKVPDHYIRKQTLVNGERFITPELKVYEEEILTAEDKSNQLEYQLFKEAIEKIKSCTLEIQALAQAIAHLDCVTNFAAVSQQRRYTRPHLTTTGDLTIEQGRHPVVEEVLTREFVPNDLTLSTDNQQLILLTGPNMAGKSVLMRQTALIVLMA